MKRINLLNGVCISSYFSQKMCFKCYHSRITCISSLKQNYNMHKGSFLYNCLLSGGAGRLRTGGDIL
jgi:hypothetical protein